MLERSRAALAKALEGGKQLTRAELGTVLQRARIDVSDGQRLGHLMMEAELDAVICSGARRGKQSTYALLDERAPLAPRLSRDEALAELATRYFATRAPGHGARLRVVVGPDRGRREAGRRSGAAGRAAAGRRDGTQRPSAAQL